MRVLSSLWYKSYYARGHAKNLGGGEKMEEKKHSGLGIASFITIIVSGILFFCGIGILWLVKVSTPGGVERIYANGMLIGVSYYTILLASLIALGLGIGGLFQKERKKIFAILGIVFSAVTIVMFITFYIINVLALR
jgi:hypothetical protein